MRINTLLLTLLLSLPVFASLSFTDRTEEALNYVKKNNLNKNYAILIDMSIHSGKYRLFLWDFTKKEIILQGLCSHGCGDMPWAGDLTRHEPTFSNVPDSHCSSLGKYKIGKRGVSSWGINVNYKLHGLEKTNNNAYKRFIVLHSWNLIPDEELYPHGTPEGWGCPSVSNSVMKKLDIYLKGSKRPFLLWIYK